MPTLNRACLHPRCPTPAERGRATCADHRPVQHEPATPRPSASRRGYDVKWRRVRAQYLKHHPVCIRCGDAAQEVDHVRPLADGGTHAWANLNALCKPCHSRKTVSENRGADGRIEARQDATAARLGDATGGRAGRISVALPSGDRGGGETFAPSKVGAQVAAARGASEGSD